MKDTEAEVYGGGDDYGNSEGRFKNNADGGQLQLFEKRLLEIEGKLRDKEQENMLLRTERDNFKKVNEKLNRQNKELKYLLHSDHEIENIQMKLENSFKLTLSYELDVLKTEHKKERSRLEKKLEKDFEEKTKEKDKQLKRLEQKLQAEEKKRKQSEEEVEKRRKKCKELKRKVEKANEDKTKMKKEFEYDKKAFEQEIHEKDALIDKLRNIPD